MLKTPNWDLHTGKQHTEFYPFGQVHIMIMPTRVGATRIVAQKSESSTTNQTMLTSSPS